MKFKRIRVILRQYKQMILLRTKKYIDKTKIPKEVYEGWSHFKTCATHIKNRPELGEQNQNRLHNMRLCAEKLSGIVIQPGRIFSLMHLIGEATEADGFKTGPMLIRGKLHRTTGGGICQVSTTIYNLALCGGLKIIEKHNHTWDTWGDGRFIELGRDATYVYGRKDISFMNPYEIPLVLTMTLDEDDLTLKASLFSEVSIDVEVETISTVLKRFGKGEKAVGWLVETQSFIHKPSGRHRIYHRIDTYKPL